MPTQVETTDYLGGFQYKNEDLQYFPTAEGYVNVTNGTFFNYVYNYTDHLGNIRLSYTQSGTELKILEENHYYPFGLKHNNYNVDIIKLSKGPDGVSVIMTPTERNNNQYKYNGKEYQDVLNLNWYDYQARNYDPAIGRWMNIDPLAEVSRRFSPYTYALNNPVRFTDPDGMMADDSINPKFTDAPNAPAGSTKAAYVSTVENATGGTHQVTVDPILNQVQFTQVSAGPVTQEQQEFTRVYGEAVDSPAVTNIEVVSNDASVTVGDIIDNKIDIADIAEFDKAGIGGSSSAGALAHETKEQQLKAESGILKGVNPPGNTSLVMHLKAIRTAENRVNNSIRTEGNGTDIFSERDGTKTAQTVTPNSSTGGINVTKTKIP